MGIQTALGRGMSSSNEHKRSAFVLRNIFRSIRQDRASKPTSKIMTKKTQTDTNLDDELNDILSNHSFHSDRTANTSTSCSSLDVTSSGTKTASSNISKYIPRRPYPNPASTGDQQPSSAHSNAGAPTPISTEKGAPDEIIIEHNNTATTTATTTANERVQMPRRSSLKKTSNYETKPSEILLPQDITNGPPSSRSAQETEHPQRRWSTTGISSTTRPESEMTMCTNQPNPPRRRRSVQFDKVVSFTIAPTAADILEKHEEGGSAKDLFYTEKEFHTMKRNIKRDAQKILKKETEKISYRCNTSSSTTTNIVNMEKNGNNNDEFKCYEKHSQKEDELCDWGIEFHTSSRADRLDRAIRLQDVIQTVLQEQESQCIDPSTGMLTEASVECLAKASAKASKMSRLQAQRRGSEAERHCRRWSSDFGVVPVDACALTTDRSEIRRHSSPHECAIHNSDGREEFNDVATTTCTAYEENDDTCNGEVLSVADASLDETTTRVRPRLLSSRMRASCA